MRPDDIREWLMQRPFQPFRLHLTNGTSFDVRHPDQARIGRSTLVIGMSPPASEAALQTERDVMVALIHITHLEPIRS